MTNTTTPAAVELVTVDPNALVIDTNIRTDAESTLDTDFVQSVATGVLQPVRATRDEDGTLRVQDGQRRTLAARQAGLTQIPVFVVGATGSGDSAQVDRIRYQWITNEQRTELTSGQKAAAMQELLDLGLSATKIAKATHTKKKVVDAALATTKSQVARQALDSVALTLHQGALVAAYDTAGDTEAVAALLAAAETGLFEHKAAELEATAEGRRVRRERAAELTAKGYTVLADEDTDHGKLVSVGMLYHLDSGRYIQDEDIASFAVENLAVRVDSDCTTGYLDANGVAVVEDDVDWSVRDEPAEVSAAEGMADPRTLTGEREMWVADESWYHRDPAADGLGTWSQYLEHKRGRAQQDTPTVEDDAEAAAAEQARQDAERAARKQVIALNKLAVAAQTVRRDKLTEALARKTLPKGKAAAVATFAAQTMWKNADLYNVARQNADAKKIAAELLGTDPMTALDGATGERAQVIALAITIGAHEANLPKDAWQGGHEYFRSIAEGRTRYLRFLAEVFGYQLAEIEQVITGDLTAEAITIS